MKKKIKLGSTEYTVIDLTQPLKLDTEVYPGDPKPEKEIFTNIKETGYEHYVYKIGDHHFHPHGDAPKHRNPNLQNKGFEVFNLNYCFNKALLIDLSGANEVKNFDGIEYLAEVKKEHLESFSETFSKVGAVLIRTGYDKWLEENRPHIPENLPYLNKAAAEFIASFDNLKVIGIDSIAVDPPTGCHDAHQALKNLLIIESLVHLKDIPVEKNEIFDLQSSPIRIVGATGGPIIAYAFIEQ